MTKHKKETQIPIIAFDLESTHLRNLTENPPDEVKGSHLITITTVESFNENFSEIVANKVQDIWEKHGKPAERCDYTLCMGIVTVGNPAYQPEPRQTIDANLSGTNFDVAIELRRFSTRIPDLDALVNFITHQVNTRQSLLYPIKH